MYYANNYLNRANYAKDNLITEAKQRVIDALKDGVDCYGSDLHDELFNTECYETDRYSAENTLENLGVFNCIAMVEDYEITNFGGVNTSLSKPCDVLNMVWYIIGEEVINDMFAESVLFNYLWNKRLSKEDCAVLVDYIKNFNDTEGLVFCYMEDMGGV